MSGGYEARTRDLLNSIIEVDQINAQQRAVLQSGEPVSRPRAAEDVGQALRPSPPGPAGPGGAMVGRRVRACLNPPDAYPISRCACDGIAWTRCGRDVTGLLSGDKPGRQVDAGHVIGRRRRPAVSKGHVDGRLRRLEDHTVDLWIVAAP